MKSKEISDLRDTWFESLTNVETLFDPATAFRREGSRAINRALFDLVMHTAAQVTKQECTKNRKRFEKAYVALLGDDEFQDLIGRAVDHTTRTKRRFEIWHEEIETAVFGL